MSDDPIQDLRGALVRAATRRHRPWWRRRPAFLAGLAVVLVAAPATAAIDRLWRPDVEPATPWPTVTATASSSASASCGERPFRGPRTTTATPPPEVLGALSVLHAPESSADRAGRAAARRSGSPRVAIRHVRLLGVDAAGGRHWIVPMLVLSRARAATADCPARKAKRTWMLRTFGETGGGGAIDVATLVRRGTTGASGPSDRESVVTGIAPDGVAQVSVAYDGAPARTWPVRRNFYSYRVALRAEQAFTPTVTWQDADGRTIQVVPGS